jgi:alpha-ketoglutarate-dependent taurine dioxygenase
MSRHSVQSCLREKVPGRGGDTIWANMYAAYEALSQAMKRYLKGMTAIHSGDGAQFEKTHEKDNARGGEVKEIKQEIAPAEHPIRRLDGKRYTLILSSPSAFAVLPARNLSRSWTTS